MPAAEVGLSVDDFSDIVDKPQRVLLQNSDSRGEAADGAEAKDGPDLPARQHRLKIWTNEVMGNRLDASSTEAHLQQPSQMQERVFQLCCLEPPSKPVTADHSREHRRRRGGPLAPDAIQRPLG